MRQNDRTLLLALLAVVLLMAGGVYFFVLNPQRPASRANNTVAADPKDNRRPAANSGSSRDRPMPANLDDVEFPPSAKDYVPEKKIGTVGSIVRGIVVNGDDEPLPGVKVSLYREPFMMLVGDTVTFSTFSQGEFEFAATLDQGPHCAIYNGQEYSFAASVSFESAPVVEGLKLVLHRPSRVFGLVLDAATRDPIEGATITVEPQHKDERLARLGALMAKLKPIKTLGDGSFEVNQLPPGPLTIVASKPGWIANELNPSTRGRAVVELGEGSNVELLPFMLVKAAEITGRVLRKDDSSPVVGATVAMGTPLGGDLGLVLTDVDGKYRLEAPPAIESQGRGAGDELLFGSVELRASAPGLGMVSVRVKPLAGKPVSAPDILLEAAATVRGKVTAKTGTPIAGAEVRYNGTEYEVGAEFVAGITTPPRLISTKSAEDGSYTLDGLPVRKCSLSASADGYCSQETTVQTVAGQSFEANFTLEVAGMIAGVITDEHGDPLEGVPVAAFRADSHPQLQTVMRSFFGEALPDRGEHPLFPPSILTDAKGNYVIKNLPAKPHVVVANSRLYAKHISKALEVKAGETTTYNITLATGGTIYGKVFDGDQHGVAGAAVTCARLTADGDIAVRTAFTDRGGNYELTGLGAGTYLVQRNEGKPESFMLPNISNMASVKAGGRTRFDIYEARPGFARLYGRVTMDGAVYAEQTIVLAGAGRKGTTVMTTKTDKLGNYEFRNLPLGRYHICEQRSDSMFPTLVRIEVVVDKAGDVQRDIAFFTVTIRGTVALEDGKLPEGNVTVYAGPVSAKGADRDKDHGDISAIEGLMAVPGSYDKEKGTFEIKGLSPGFYRVTAIANNIGAVRRPYIDARQSVLNLHLVITRDTGAIMGTAKGLDGIKPATPMGWGAAAIIEDANGDALQLPFGGVVRLNDKKEFTISYLPPGTYSVTLQISGYAPCTVNGVVVESGKTAAVEFTIVTSGSAKVIVDGGLNLDEAYELTYEIRDSAGNLFKKRFTIFDFVNGDGTVIQSENENAFVIRDLPQDSYTISFTHPAYQPASAAFTVTAGQTVDVPVTFKKK
ncbi:MAG: carboxypeptidase regulatory-like domain-containing protein [Planctomycetes bacterium]|nr:carboxypeptidase regulatory-like domain-containing protein [Planctomycetota bacterium]